MASDLTVLVLGVGGNVSQGILKALAISNLKCRVVGACISPLAAGLYTVDRAYVSVVFSEVANEEGRLRLGGGYRHRQIVYSLLPPAAPIHSVHQ